MNSPNERASPSLLRFAGPTRILGVLAAVIIGLILGIALERASTKNVSIDQHSSKENAGTLTCYYAHPHVSYGSQQESEDLQLLESLGFKVINPNIPEYQVHKDMAFYLNLAASADVVAFRSLPDGNLSPGVSQELRVAKRRIELPSNVEARSYHP
jgi:hypothetical protein